MSKTEEVDHSLASSSGNPLAHGFNVTVTIPNQINIRMVDASALSDYELWVFVASGLLSAFFGFLVATIQSFGTEVAGPMVTMTLILLVLFVVAGLKSLSVRKRLTAPGKLISMREHQ